MVTRRALAWFVLAAAASAAEDPFAGTWRLDTTKSSTTLKNISAAPRNVEVTYEPGAGVTKVRTVVTWASGNTNSSLHVVRYDGKFYPRFAGAPAGDEMMSRRIDLRTEESVQRKDGEVVVTTRRVVAPDGASMTVTAKYTAGKEKAETVMVYRKVR
jgi:hypothetical protein